MSHDSPEQMSIRFSENATPMRNNRQYQPSFHAEEQQTHSAKDIKIFWQLADDKSYRRCNKVLKSSGSKMIDEKSSNDDFLACLVQAAALVF
jgi:hypothetical protein